MKLGSVECIKVLENYEVKNDIEMMAIKVLLVPYERAHEIVDLPGMADLTGEQIDELAKTIGKIRDDLSIEEEEA